MRYKVIKAAGALAVTGGIVVAAALPAAASSPNRGIAARATGVINAGPLGEANYPGVSPVTLASANVPGLFTTGGTTTTAGPTSASATVNNLGGILSTLASLHATSARSSCRFSTDTGNVTGTASITNGSVTRTGGGTTPLASNPAPNTHVTVAGIATITLNRQTTATDGTLTVTAIYVSLTGSVQTYSIAISVCNRANLAPVPVLPGKSLEFTIGGLGAAAIIGAAYQIARRRRMTAAA